MKTLYVSAGLVLTEGTDRTFAIEQMTELVEATIKEPGCRHFEVLAHKEDESRFTLWECWDNEAALQAHFQAPHTQAYLALDLTRVAYIEKLEAMNA
ncbi:putative quinol monooxygenase [Oceanospirillum beijerinckii]|uniref:putative quinol monooxygenase n=1 Tax=Oceanospirillum beijerinckii TaxID=64976 RepID=UPI000411B2CC|nr:putative quinol monooxygenase [Oceanospirillum beijerinckii]